MYYRPKTQIKQQLSKKLKTQKSQGKSLSGTISKTSNTNDNKQQHKINELEEEISRLKTTQKITETTNIDETKINNPPQEIQKTKMWPLQTNRGQKENIDLLKIINFVAETMKTLSNYREQMKIQLDLNLTQQGM